MEHRFSLVDYGNRLWTRDRAREIRNDLVVILDSSSVGDCVIIDSGGVEVFDISFANEFFGRTILDLPKSNRGRFIVVENLGEYARENLEKALESLGLVIIEQRDGKLDLIGKVHPTDKVTFKAIATSTEPVTSSELKERLNINLTAMNERLKKLTELGIIRRDTGISPAGREQFEYTVLK